MYSVSKFHSGKRNAEEGALENGKEHEKQEKRKKGKMGELNE